MVGGYLSPDEGGAGAGCTLFPSRAPCALPEQRCQPRSRQRAILRRVTWKIAGLRVRRRPVPVRERPFSRSSEEQTGRVVSSRQLYGTRPSAPCPPPDARRPTPADAHPAFSAKKAVHQRSPLHVCAGGPTSETINIGTSWGDGLTAGRLGSPESVCPGRRLWRRATQRASTRRRRGRGKRGGQERGACDGRRERADVPWAGRQCRWGTYDASPIAHSEASRPPGPPLQSYHTEQKWGQLRVIR